MKPTISIAISAWKGRLRSVVNHVRQWRIVRPFRVAIRYWRVRNGGLPDWPTLLGGSAVPPFPIIKSTSAQPPGKRILIATGTAGHLPSITVESYLGMALRERAADVEFLLCDKALPACMMCEINWYSDVAAFARSGPRDQCGVCHDPSADMLTAAGLRHIGLSSALTTADLQEADNLATRFNEKEIRECRIDDVAVGEHALAGALRFFARGELPNVAVADAVLRRYFKAALLSLRACQSLFRSGRYDVVVLNHGIYVPQGVIAETARREGVRVVTWHPAYRRGCFIFNHHETYHHGLMTEPVSAWEDMLWGEPQQQRIADYLRSRWIGREDWVRFHHDPIFDVTEIERDIGIDLSRPTVGLLTNVVWDAQLHYPANAFVNMLDWLLKTIAYFAGRDDLQLLIRVHPAERSGTLPSLQPVLEEIRKAFPDLPKNVFIIPSESRLSTYVAMSGCNAVIIYGTKTGVELTASGKPVIVAGESWIRGKGVTQDANSEDEYFAFLNALPLPAGLAPAMQERAIKYAFHFFFRRMIPLKGFVQSAGWPPFKIAISGIDDLKPGACKGLDLVCAGILNGSSFVYPAEDEVT